MNNKTIWGSACSLARITWPGSMGLISASQPLWSDEAPQVAIVVASSRHGRCQFAGAKIQSFFGFTNSFILFFQIGRKYRNIIIYICTRARNFVDKKFANVRKMMYLCAAISIIKAKRFVFLWIRHKYIAASKTVFPMS